MALKIILVLTCATFISVSGNTLKQDEEVIQTVDSDTYNTNLEENQTTNSTASHLGLKPGLKIRLPFAGSGCTCQNKKCSCCASIYVQSIDYDRQACAVVTYAPSQVVNFEVVVNTSNPSNGTLRRSFSAKATEPKQYCVPIMSYSPMGPVDFCVRLFGITFVENKLHLCMNMLTRVSEQAVFHLKLDCIDLDMDPTNPTQDGTATLKPSQPDSDVYDPVVPENAATTTIQS